MRQGEPHHAHGLDQVALQRAAPILIAAVGNARPAATTADIVDQDIDAAVSGDGGVDQPGCIGGIGDIGCVSRDRGAGTAQRRFRIVQRLGRASRQHDPTALGGKRLGGRQPYAAARSGNQHDLAGQFQIHAATPPNEFKSRF